MRKSQTNGVETCTSAVRREMELQQILRRIGTLPEVDSELVEEYNFIVNSLSPDLGDPDHFRIGLERLRRRRKCYTALDGSQISIWERYASGETLRRYISELLAQLHHEG